MPELGGEPIVEVDDDRVERVGRIPAEAVVELEPDGSAAHPPPATVQQQHRAERTVALWGVHPRREDVVPGGDVVVHGRPDLRGRGVDVQSAGDPAGGDDQRVVL